MYKNNSSLKKSDEKKATEKGEHNKIVVMQSKMELTECITDYDIFLEIWDSLKRQ